MMVYNLTSCDTMVLASPAREGASDEESREPVTTVAKPKTAAAAQFAYEGEVKEIPPAKGYALLAKYREAAKALHTAKENAKQIEAEIMQELGGYEHGAVDGQIVFNWPFVDSTSFDAKGFKETSPEYKALYESFLVTKETRRFKVDGTVGVD